MAIFGGSLETIFEPFCGDCYGVYCWYICGKFEKQYLTVMVSYNGLLLAWYLIISSDESKLRNNMDILRHTLCSDVSVDGLE